jgi:hypothetical protein
MGAMWQFHLSKFSVSPLAQHIPDEERQLCDDCKEAFKTWVKQGIKP